MNQLLVPLTLSLALASWSHAQTCAGPNFLGTMQALGVSADGHVVVGTVAGNSCRWTESGGFEVWGSGRATDASADGRAVVGSTRFTTFESSAFLWTASGGFSYITGVGSGSFPEAAAVSDDGTVVVGGSLSAFRWSAAGGLQLLKTLGGNAVSAFDVSGDGLVVVGSSEIASGEVHAFRWTAAGGMEDLGPGTARATNFDGTVVVGVSPQGRAFRWTAATGMQDLGEPAGFSVFESRANDVSGDGSVVVGTMTLPSLGGSTGFRWTEGAGMQFTYFTGDAAAVSADGSVIVGGNTRVQSSVIGRISCRPDAANSSGCAAVLLAGGDPRVALGSLELTASLLPARSFGYFVASRTERPLPMLVGSFVGPCHPGAVYRLDSPGQIMSSGASGSFAINVDPGAVPTSAGALAIQAGETWNFQAWFRDAASGTATNLATDVVSITFR